MAEKILNTRIQLKYDTYENWTTKNPVLKKGEMAIATIAAGNTQKVNSVTPPQVLIKVGDGTTNYNALPFASGMAADVYSWAKAETPVAIDTDTQYKFEVDSTNKDEKKTVYKISKRTWSNGAWSKWAEEFTFEALTPEQINTYVIGQDTDTKDTDTIKGAKLYADNVKTTVIGQDGDLKTAETIYGAKKYADEAANTVKTTVIGTNADLSSAETIYGAKKYTDEKIAEIPAQTDYTVTVDTSETTAGALKSYAIKQLGETVATIDIPKDYLVKSASCKTATEADKPITGLKKGDPYLDFVINTKDTEAGSGTEDHVYINVANLVDVYTAEDGINIRDNKVSVKLDTSNANGLSVDSAGLKLAVASGTNNGAMSSTSYTDLQTAKTDIDALKKVGATKVEKSDTNGNIKINGAETTVYTHPATHAASEITGLADIATTGNVNDLVQTTGDVLVFDCGNATI